MKEIKYEEMTFSNIPEEKEIASVKQFCLDYELFSKKSLDVFKKADKYIALSIPVVFLISCIITTAANFVLFPTEAPILTNTELTAGRIVFSMLGALVLTLIIYISTPPAATDKIISYLWKKEALQEPFTPKNKESLKNTYEEYCNILKIEQFLSHHTKNTVKCIKQSYIITPETNEMHIENKYAEKDTGDVKTVSVYATVKIIENNLLTTPQYDVKNGVVRIPLPTK